MSVRELAEDVMPSAVFAMVSFDTETHEVGIQYGYVLLSLPREDFESFVELLVSAGERLEGSKQGREGEHGSRA